MNMKNYAYDVFVSYNSNDVLIAQYIVSELKKIGLKVWFDKERLRPGGAWVVDLHKSIGLSRSVLVLIGENDIGPWQMPEIRKAFEDYIYGGGSVIPVFLPGVEKIELPDFLRQHTWVDCRNGFLDINVFKDIVWGISGRKLESAVVDFDEEFYLTIKRKNNHDKLIKVFTVNNIYKNKLRHISWQGFGWGIDNLVEQISENGSSLNIDLNIGINDAGLVMATFINSRCFNRSSLGYIRTRKVDGRITIDEGTILPEMRENPEIMIYDFEIKYANVLSEIMFYLKDHYKNPLFYFCVFGAMTESDSLKIANISDLVSYGQLNNSDIQDLYMVCTMHPPGIEPPLEIR